MTLVHSTPMAWMLAISQLHASAGYYYQHRDQEDVDGSGVRGRA